MAQPRRILKELLRPAKTVKPSLLVPIEQTLNLWGTVRDFGTDIEEGRVPKLEHWRENLQPFQLEHLRRYIPKILTYLQTVNTELE